MAYRLIEETPNQEIIKSKFRLIEETPEKEASTETISPKTEKIAESFKFFGYKPSPETIEKIRHPTGVALKGFTKGLLGTPGEILGFVQRLAGVDESKKILPTTEDVGKFFENLSKEEFNPQNISEEFADRGFEFLGSILGLGGPLKATTPFKAFGRNILASFVPAGVSLFSEKAKMPPWMQAASTIGTSFLIHRMTGKGLKDLEKALYKQAESLSRNQYTNSRKMAQSLKPLKEALSKGGMTGPKSAVKTFVKEIEQKGKFGKIAVDDLLEFKRNIYEKMGEFEKIKGSKGLWKMLGKAIDRNIKEFERTNPEFRKVYRDANSLHKGMMETNKIANWLKKNPITKGASSIILKLAFPSALKPALISATGAQSALFLKALAKNPGYRKAYFNVLKSAAKEEGRVTAQALKKFNKKTKEEFPELIVE